MVYADIRIAAQSNEDLLSFLKFCSIVQGAGDIGAGRSVKVFVDGDGSGRYLFQVLDQTQEQVDIVSNVPSTREWTGETTLWLGE